MKRWLSFRTRVLLVKLRRAARSPWLFELLLLLLWAAALAARLWQVWQSWAPLWRSAG